MKSFVPALTFLLLLLAVQNSQSQSSTGTEFWLGYMENLDLAFNDDPRFFLYVEAEQTTTVTVSVPATGFAESFLAAANDLTTYEFPMAIWYSEGSELVDNKGIRISSDQPVEVYAFHYRLYFSESTQLLPLPALGDEYYPTCYEDPGSGSTSPSSFVIVSTADNTEVEITPTTLTLGLHPAGVPFTAVLDEGQNYQVKAIGDLSGSRIRSLNGAPLAVFSGAQQANVEVCSGGADSHLYDQAIPVADWGKAYYFVPFSAQGGDPVKIIAAEDNTTVFLDCNELVSLSAGEVFEVKLTQAGILNSEQPFSVAQFNSSQSCNPSGVGDPNMLQLFPTANQGTSFRWLASDLGSYFSDHFVNIVAPSDGIAGVNLDGLPQSAAFTPFPANPDWSYAQIAVAPGDHLLTSSQPIYAYSYGFGDFDAYTYNLGYSSQEEVAFTCLDIFVNGLFCVDSLLQFSSESNLNIVGYNWDFGGQGTSSLPNPSFSFAQSGTYLISLEVSLADGTTVSESLEITILECPVDPCQNLDTPMLTFTGTPCEVPLVFSYQADSIFQNVIWDFGPFGFSTEQSPLLDPQEEGVYTFTFQGFDAYNCIYEASITVEIPNCGDPCANAGEIPIVLEGVLCVDSIITVTTDPVLDPFGGGNPGEDFFFFDFIVSNGEFYSFTPVFEISFSEPGTYTIEFSAFSSDFCDYVGGIEFTIDDNCVIGPCENLPQVSIVPNGEFCLNEPLTFTLSTTAEIVDYFWTTEGATSTSSSLVATYSEEGVYTVQFSGTDQEGCLYEETLLFDVSDCQVEPCDDLPPIDILVAGGPCTDQTIQFSVATLANLVAYEWDLGNGSFPTTASPQTTYTAAGVYEVQLTAFDLQGCEYQATLTWTVEECDPCLWQEPVTIQVVDGATPCVGEPFSFEFLTTAEVVSINWVYNGIPFGSAAETDPILAVIPALNNEISLTLVDVEGCVFDTTLIFDILACPCPDDLMMEVAGDSCIGGEWVLSYTTMSTVTSTQWLVNGEEVSTNATYNLANGSPDPVAVVLQVFAEDGCVQNDTLILTGTTCVPEEDCTIFFPNIFSPNGDQVNDTFGALYKCPPTTFEFRIYSRWGGLMFETTNPGQAWDGTLQGKPCPSDTYAFIAEYAIEGSQAVITQSGDITLIR